MIKTHSAAKTSVPYATFFVGDMLLGIQVQRIREVNKNLEWTSVPHAPPFVLGAMSLRGEVLTVVDLSLLLGMEPNGNYKNKHNIIVQVGDELVGLIVDRVSEIHRIPVDAVETAPGNIHGLDAKVIRGVYQTDRDVVVILNADEILSEN
jgi:purine-binding chemotaxis protein CheW